MNGESASMRAVFFVCMRFFFVSFTCLNPPAVNLPSTWHVSVMFISLQKKSSLSAIYPAMCISDGPPRLGRASNRFIPTCGPPTPPHPAASAGGSLFLQASRSVCRPRWRLPCPPIPPAPTKAYEGHRILGWKLNTKNSHPLRDREWDFEVALRFIWPAIPEPSPSSAPAAKEQDDLGRVCWVEVYLLLFQFISRRIARAAPSVIRRGCRDRIPGWNWLSACVATRLCSRFPAGESPSGYSRLRRRLDPKRPTLVILSKHPPS